MSNVDCLCAAVALLRHGTKVSFCGAGSFFGGIALRDMHCFAVAYAEFLLNMTVS